MIPGKPLLSALRSVLHLADVNDVAHWQGVVTNSAGVRRCAACDAGMGDEPVCWACVAAQWAATDREIGWPVQTVVNGHRGGSNVSGP